jgi:hypothetical protein
MPFKPNDHSIFLLQKVKADSFEVYVLILEQAFFK